MKIALVHDGLFCRGGGEKILLLFQEAFPNSVIYTSIYDADATYPEFKNSVIQTSWFSRIAKNEKEYKDRYFPFAIIAMHQLDLTGYDVVLMATTHCSKYVKYSKKAKVFAYTFTPFRFAWNPDSYTLFSESGYILRFMLGMLIKLLRSIDKYYSQRIPHFIAMTQETKERLITAYNPKNQIQILNPPIDITKFRISDTVEDYYLVVSRLEKYKKVDLVIETFNTIDKPLVIVGRGVEKERLTKIAGNSITFIEDISDEKLSLIYSKAKALIFPQHEDYGLTPLEAAACGRPVIAYGYGGICDTMIPYNGENELVSTAVFFYEQTQDSLIRGIKLFEGLRFDPIFIRDHASKFHKDKFINRIKELVLNT